MNDKYLVYKPQVTHDELLPGELVDDAVVIRLKDPFAATALFTYANTILSFIELMERGNHLDEGEKERLLGIADYFHLQAVQSQAIAQKKLPD